jgi:Cu/Ag efflux protein CusF
MQLWKAIVLLNLALALGVGGGYLWWARDVRALREELARERETAARGQAGPRVWSAHGIVRLVLKDQNAIFLTHETIPGLMEGMTMGFQAAGGTILDGLAPGDRVLFTVELRDGRLLVVGVQKEQTQKP